MRLDIPTLLFADALLSFALAAAVYVARPVAAQAARGVLTWSIASALCGVGRLLLLTRGIGPDAVSVWLPNISLLTVYLLAAAAVGSFLNRPLPRWLMGGWLISVATLFALVPWGSDAFALRVVLFSALSVVGVAVILGRLRHAPRGLGGVRLLRVAFGLHAVVMTLRVAGTLASDTSSLFAPFAGQLPMFVTNMVINTAASIGFLMMMHDAVHSRLEMQSRLDPLTEVLNRRGFMERLQHALTTGPGADTKAPCLIAIDLDHFKRINDRWGHAAGDRVLVAFAQVLNRHAAAAAVAAGRPGQDRRARATGPSSAPLVGDPGAPVHIGRMGGEEFVVLLSSADAPTARLFAQRLREALADAPIGPAGEPITFSAGIASAAEAGAGVDIDRLLRLADERLYRAKRQRDAIVCAVSAAATQDFPAEALARSDLLAA